MNIEYGSEADGSQKKYVPAVKTQRESSKSWQRGKLGNVFASWAELTK